MDTTEPQKQKSFKVRKKSQNWNNLDSIRRTLKVEKFETNFFSKNL
jgi:hypothetical protein